MKNTPIKPIKNLIICDPYEIPSLHWRYNREKRKFELVAGRRPAGFVVATQGSKTFDDPGEFRKLELVNKIRERIKKWRENNYPNVTSVTKQLLEFWNNRAKEEKRLFFCQLEAIETIIWFTESLETERLGISIPTDGGDFTRLCTKMATGTGKTVVMAMLIAWHVINKATYPNDRRFSKNILIIAPGLTVKKRLEVLNPKNPDGNYYDEFEIVPNGLWEKLLQGKITIHNWHTLKPIEDEKYNVVKKGTESNYAFARRILKFDSKNIIVINDEAHHAWRNLSMNDSSSWETTKWIEGLDKIHQERNIMKCYDFSATPFIPTGKSVEEEKLFKWIISDFSLNDAIESGLTKTPRIAIRDDSGKFDKNYKSRFYHIYLDPEVKPDLNRRAKPEEGLPDLVNNAYMLLGQDWLETMKFWNKHQNNKKTIPPVMVTVCNQTSTSERIEQFFKNNKIGINELADSKYVLRIDSAKLKAVEKNNEVNPESKNRSEILRQKVNTVGKRGTMGEQLRNIIAVQMITEGWDARNVTHIMGLRAFTSQLLCEQTVGRGLRRMSYDINPKTNLFEPEYVNIFGVPFTFLPHEGGDNGPLLPPSPTTLIEPDPEKNIHEISWPNIDRINIEYAPILVIDWTYVHTLKLKSNEISTTVGMAAILDGKPHVDKMSDIDLYELNKEIRLQKIIFLAAIDIYDNMCKFWTGNKEFLIAQLIKLTEQFMNTDKIIVTDVPKEDELRTRMTILFNMRSVVRHLCNAINEKNVEQKQIMLNVQIPIKSTKMMRPWHTKKIADYAEKNHINLAVYDSGWEITAGNEFERNKNVVSWVKNDHIGFVIKYSYNGHLHDYYPDFLIRLANNVMLVLEIKGRDNEQNRTKRKYLKEWTIAVNEDGRYGTWVCDVAFQQAEIKRIIAKHSKTDMTSRTQAKCPSCKKIAKKRYKIEDEFGYRNVDGIIRPQSWCRKCRNRSSKQRNM